MDWLNAIGSFGYVIGMSLVICVAAAKWLLS